MNKKIVVIGGTAAGLSAATKAKRTDPSLQITVYERSGYVSYGACGLPYFVGGLIPKAEDLISLTQEQLKYERGIDTFIHHEVVKINREDKTILVKNLDQNNGSPKEVAYDKLVIATGATPIIPDIDGLRIEGKLADNVFTMRTVEDGILLREKKKTGKKLVVIGGGMIGLEMAEQLTENGLIVTVVEAAPQLLPAFPAEYAEKIKTLFTQKGVTILTGVTVVNAENNGKAINKLHLSNETELEMDYILISIGVSPENGLAKECGLELGIKGAIVVDQNQRTSDPDIFACGDCAQTYHALTGKPAYMPLGTHANKQGKVTGNNIAGIHDRFDGVLSSNVTLLYGKVIGSTGFTLQQALENGWQAKSISIIKGDRASYYPGGMPCHITLVFDVPSGRVLGASAFGGETTAGRLNTLAAAIRMGMTTKQLEEMDFVYMPALAPVYDPMLIAASSAQKARKKE